MSLNPTPEITSPTYSPEFNAYLLDLERRRDACATPCELEVLGEGRVPRIYDPVNGTRHATKRPRTENIGDVIVFGGQP